MWPGGMSEQEAPASLLPRPLAAGLHAASAA